MSLTENDVQYLAGLAALELQDAEIEKTRKDINDFLDYAERLQAVSTLGVSPTAHVHNAGIVLRDDIVQDSLHREEVEAGAPEFRAGFFRVPKIIG